MDLSLFLPLVKVDVERRLVYGCVAAEVADKAGEIMDYETAKPQFAAWSAEIEKASDGKSLGNLRAMHGNVAAGKLTSIAFDDDARRIEACGKIVDDAEWAKVLEGVYTGFSMGGKYLRRWQDTDAPHLVRYTPQPHEVSLVDNPCIPAATFEVVKADGSTELRKFKTGDAAAEALDKEGARNSAADLEKIQALHDTAVELGADCAGSADGNDPDGIGTTVTLDEDDLIAIASARVVVQKFILGTMPKIEALALEVAGLRADVDRLNAEPAPGGPVLAHAVMKGQDARGGATVDAENATSAFRKHLETLAPGERARALMKMSLANPLTAAPRG